MEDKQPINSEAHEDVIDVEEFAKAGKPVPPRAAIQDPNR